MIILEVFKEFPEREEVILPALYSLHSLAGPCKCTTGSHFQFFTSHSLRQLTRVHGNLSVTVKANKTSESLQGKTVGSAAKIVTHFDRGNGFEIRIVWELLNKSLFCFLWEILTCNFLWKFSYSVILTRLESLISG